MRYFVDKNPVFLPAAPEGGARTVGFAYIQAASDTTAGLRTYLEQYRRLLKAVPAFRLVFVTTDSKLIPAAKKAFSKMVGCGVPSQGPDRETQRLLEHFDARICHEHRDYSGFDTAGLQRLSRELREFSGARFDWLFTLYKAGGRARVLAEIAPGSGAEESAKASFEACILEHSYKFVGDGWAA